VRLAQRHASTCGIIASHSCCCRRQDSSKLLLDEQQSETFTGLSPMEIQHLRTFIEVVRQGSFAGAAKRLGLASSQVTRAVAAVETELGARLLHRTTRKVAPTEAGDAYFKRVIDVLEQLDAASDDIRASTGEVRGNVCVTASVALGQMVVMPLVKVLHQRHPGIELDLRFSDSVVDLVGQQVDIALRQGTAAEDSLAGVQLAPLRYRVCASPDYVKRIGRPTAPSDLSRCSCLRFSHRDFGTEWSFRTRGCADAAVEKVRVGGWLVASSALSLHTAALEGLGPVLLAEWLVSPDIDAGRLIDLFPAYEATATDFSSAIWLLYASRQHLPTRVRTVIDFLKNELRQRIVR
jgi:DNA-binding transcriptional LysR family regulator